MMLSSGKSLVPIGGACSQEPAEPSGEAGSGLSGPSFLLLLSHPHIPKGRNSHCQVGLCSPLISNHPEAAGQQEARLTGFSLSVRPSGSSALLQVAMLASGSGRGRAGVF